MKNLFIFFLICLNALYLSAGNAPDFRYPKSVAKTAESDLRFAMNRGDGEGVVDALIRYSLAWSSISEEHLQDITTRIEQIADKPETTIDIRALLLHLEARVIEAHPNRWQHLNLNSQMDSLFEASLRDLPSLTQFPLSNYQKIIDFGEQPYGKEQLSAQRMLPTLAEFLVFHTRQRGRLQRWNERRPYLQAVLEKERQDSSEMARVYRENQHVCLTRPGILGSHDSLRIQIEYKNVEHLQIEVFALTDTLTDTNRWKLPRKQLKRVSKHYVNLILSQRDTLLSQTVVLPPLPYGRYVVGHSFIDRSHHEQHLEDFFEYDLFSVTDVEEVGVKIIDRESHRREDNTFHRLLLDRESGRPLESPDPADTHFKHRNYYQETGLYHDTVFTIQILTDRGLYRPGETVCYTAVLQGNTVDQCHLLPHHRVITELLDTQQRTLQKDTLLTDEFGQVKGSFQLPSEGRTGHFSLRMEASVGDKEKANGWHTISVSQYKAPTFDIDFSESPSLVQYADSVFTLRGRVMTFSGVPVSKRDVRLTLSKHSWWRWYGGGDEFASYTVWTDQEGRFSLQLGMQEVVGKNPSRHTYLTVKAACTNAGGETQENEHTLQIECPKAIEEPEPLAESQQVALQPQIPADITEEMIPDSVVLWIHELYDKTITADHEALVRIGTSLPDAYIYYIVSDARGTLKHGWLHYAKPGLHDFTFPMPQPTPLTEYPTHRELHFQFMAMRSGLVYTEECTFLPATEPDQIHLSRVTFRDHLIPGGKETWTFRIQGTRLNQLQQRSRLLLGLYDAALDKIEHFRWGYDTSRTYRSHSGFEICGYYGSRSRDLYYTEPLDLIDPQWPELNLYGQNFFDVRTRNTGKVLYEMADNGAHLFAEKAASPEEVLVMGYGVVQKRAPEVALDAADAAQSLSNVRIREGQQRLALWEPMLTTDSSGIVSITFEVPDQNTTWHMQALAFSPWGTFAQFDTTLLAQRPLMVQPSLPRFVRQGDRMNLSGLVLNATGFAQQVTALVEVYNPRSQQMIATHASQLQLEAGAQKSVEVTLLVPDTLEQIAFRIRSQVEGGEYDGFGDGEQRLLPVLPAVSPVIETIPFYLNPGDEAFTIHLPDSLPDGADIQLEWCDNPIVYCLEALPSLMEEVFPTSSSLIHRLFAYAVSEQVVHRYPVSLADSLLHQLTLLQNPDGGFSWIDFRERSSSFYATAEVLELLGEMHQLGAYSLPEPLTTRALQYYDRVMADHYYQLSRKQRKKLDCSYYSHYLYLRSLFPEHDLPSRSRKLYKTALKQCADRWGELDLAGRGYVALALSRQSGEGRFLDPKTAYRSAARHIVESLRQFSLIHPHRGMYWDQLEYSGYRWLGNVSQTSLLLQAFAAIDPRTEELDQIRKWLLLEKQTTHWGNSSLAADAIYALLHSGTEWQSRQQIEALKYDSIHDRLLQRDTLSLIRQLPSATRRVEIPAAASDHPSWGAVYMKYAAPTRTAEAAGNEEILIQKELVDGGSGLKVGDKVTIRLRITTTREMDEVQICDERAACFEPADQLSGYHWGRELGYYYEPLDQRTLFFIPHLPKGEHWISYDVRVTSEGDFALGLASVQCQYAPMFNAHTAGNVIQVSPYKKK